MTGKPAPRKIPKWGKCSSTCQQIERAKFGVELLSDAVLAGQHTFVLILEAENREYIENFMQPFAMAGSVEISGASTCETVVERESCEPVAAAD